jgi:hypothetical protein
MNRLVKFLLPAVVLVGGCTPYTNVFGHFAAYSNANLVMTIYRDGEQVGPDIAPFGQAQFVVPVRVPDHSYQNPNDPYVNDREVVTLTIELKNKGTGKPIGGPKTCQAGALITTQITYDPVKYPYDSFQCWSTQ